MGYKDEADEILDSVLIGMYMRDPEGNFVPLDDKYNVLRNDALNSLVELHKREMREAIGEDEKVTVIGQTRPLSSGAAYRNGLRNSIRKKAGL